MLSFKVLSKSSRNRGSWIIVLCIVSIIIGFVAGFCTARLLEFERRPKSDRKLSLQNLNLQKNVSYRELLKPHNHTSENSSVAQKLYNQVRVLCWIMTSPENHQSRAIHVKRTWGLRCNKLIFISSEEDKELDAVALNLTEDYEHLWGKTKKGFKYIYENHIEDADWFLKADDDTYVILENLRYMLYPYAPEFPIYFGCKYKAIVKQGYMSGGAGYVLSKEALRRFVTEALPNKTLCKDSDTGAEDAEMGKCLEAVQVIAGDSRDAEGRGKFFPFEPSDHLNPNQKIDMSFWYWKNIYYKIDVETRSCSDYAVSFHYIKPDIMYVLNYFIYHLRRCGIALREEILPEKLTLEEIMISANVSWKTNSSNFDESAYYTYV